MFTVRLRVIQDQAPSSSRSIELHGVPRAGDVIWVSSTERREGERQRLYVRLVEWFEGAGEGSDPILTCSREP